MKTHFEVIIIGGGTAGIMVAAQLRRKNKDLSIVMMEPSDTHHYQAAWTLVASGEFSLQKTRRKVKEFIPKNVVWIQDKATDIQPESHQVVTEKSGTFTYDYLVVAPGLVMAPELLPGLSESLNKGEVCSVYSNPEYTREVIQRFKGGNAIFTQPTTAIKCGGAPQKIMYMAEDYFRKKGIRNQVNHVFATPGSVIFGLQEFARPLEKIIKERDIIFKTYYAPAKIDSENRKIHFKYLNPHLPLTDVLPDERIKEHITEANDIVMEYDMLHLAPPQKPPAFLEKSDLVYKEGKNAGWVEVDIYSMQHVRYPHIFSLGDVAALPTAKTGAAIRKQAPVVVANILQHRQNQTLSPLKYEGYSSCPIITSYGKMLLAEFKYNNIRDTDPMIGMFFDTTKPSRAMWLLKKYGLPFLYWNFMLKGKM
jgi:sulfide:quinone oxidoreductase